MEKFFTRNIIDWHLKENKRIMPWKGEKNPYEIWISEIILQQTRVVQGVSYYNNFITKFPTVKSLAEADDEAVFKIWEGLGYYSRCKNLLAAARHIAADLNENFPTTYQNLLKLKGIGPHTAAAISSFAYGLPHAVVDGNVFRVLSRFFGEATPVDSPKGKKLFTALADKVLFKKDSAAYNQGIMDFGATVCKPHAPECEFCILREKCIAFREGVINKLPVKEKRIVKRTRYFNYFIFTVGDEVLVRKRLEKDIWQNLYEFHLFETGEKLTWGQKQVETWLHHTFNLTNFSINHTSPYFIQQLTHQNLVGRFISVALSTIPASLQHLAAVKNAQFSSIAFPTFINKYLQLHPVFNH